MIYLEIWSIDPEYKLKETPIDIPRSCVSPFLLSDWRTPNKKALVSASGSPVSIFGGGPVGVTGIGYKFQFPTAIASDLRRVAVPERVFSIPLPREVVGSQKPDRGIGEHHVDLKDGASQNRAFGFSTEGFGNTYDLQMSDDGMFLLTIQKSIKMMEVHGSKRCNVLLITVYHNDVTQNSTEPAYRYMDSLACTSPQTESASRKNETSQVLLHPRYPVIAVNHNGMLLRRYDKPGIRMAHSNERAALWRFGENGRLPSSDLQTI